MTLCLAAFASQGLSSVEQQYSNIEREALGILHVPKKFHHCCFAKEVYITDYKPLVPMANKDVAILSNKLQCIMLQSINIACASSTRLALNYI